MGGLCERRPSVKPVHREIPWSVDGSNSLLATHHGYVQNEIAKAPLRYTRCSVHVSPNICIFH